jgi:SAM-dependent methyltransferase
MITTLEYRLLRWLAPGEPTHMSGAAYAGKSKLTTLLGSELLDRAREQEVLDFGCGIGTEAMELSQHAKAVFGLDINERQIEQARSAADERGLNGRCEFGTRVPAGRRFDVIVSIDSFEHFDDPAAVLKTMRDLLAPSGVVLISFGPTWYHPLGGHLFSIFPWAHLLFSEEALIRWRSDIRSDGATRFSEVEGGLNQMTIRRFERLAHASGLSVEYLETVPIRKLKWAHAGFTREFTTAVVRAVLAKPAR